MALPEPASPCIRLCQLDEAKRLCIGCHRTIEEIAGWSRYSPIEKAAVLEKLPERRQSLGRATIPIRTARAQRPSRRKACAKCATEFLCGPQAPGADCWCDHLPNVLPLTTTGCLCPNCLDQAVTATVRGNDR